MSRLPTRALHAPLQVRAFVNKLHSADCALDHFACTDSVGAVSAWLEGEAADAAVTRGEPSKAREITREITRDRTPSLRQRVCFMAVSYRAEVVYGSIDPYPILILSYRHT